LRPLSSSYAIYPTLEKNLFFTGEDESSSLRAPPQITFFSGLNLAKISGLILGEYAASLNSRDRLKKKQIFYGGIGVL